MDMLDLSFLTVKIPDKQIEESASIEKKHLLQYERNLIAAVLGRAICDLFHTRKRHRRIRASAKRWIANDENGLLSFVWCCHHLDLDPVELRQILKNMARPNYIRGEVLEALG